MEPNSVTSLREMLEQMSTAQLDEMLNNELRSVNPSADAVRMIMQVLRVREKDVPVEVTPQIQKAWEKYQRDSEKIWNKAERTRIRQRRIVQVASTAAILVILLVTIVPQQVGADSIWRKIASWTEDFFGFKDPNAVERPQEEYMFRTDLEGLQQIYDTLVELGVEDPKIPTWLPGEPELVELKTTPMSALNIVQATLANDSGRIIFKINVYNSNVDNEYHKDQTLVSSFEKDGTTYNVMQNNGMWTAAWLVNNIEYSFTTDCQEDTLLQILESIYTVEEK